MSGAKTGSAFLIAILAAIVLPCAGIAQMQQSGTQDSTSTTPSRNDATATSTAANPAGASGGASTWTSGKGSFGATGRTSARSSAGATGGSWAAGSGSFGMKAQPDGIWHENGGGSMGTPNTAPTQSPAAEGLVPAALPGLPAEFPATASSPGGARSGGIPASGSRAGGHPGSGAQFAASSGPRTGAGDPRAASRLYLAHAAMLARPATPVRDTDPVQVLPTRMPERSHPPHSRRQAPRQRAARGNRVPDANPSRRVCSPQ